MAIDKLMTRTIVHASQEDTVGDVIRLMIKNKVSSVLLHDDEMKVVGIFTERDVVRKFVLLQKEDKLDAKIITVMSRPVIYADAGNLEQSVKTLHEKYGFRHFPVKAESSESMQEVLGILTLTDFLKPSLQKADEPKQQISESAQENLKFAMLCNSSAATEAYRKLLKVYEIDIDLICGDENIRQYLASNERDEQFLFYDMDFFSVNENLEYLEMIKKSPLILVTSVERLLAPYRSYFSEENQHIFLKPLDFSYLAWLTHQYAKKDKRKAS